MEQELAIFHVGPRSLPQRTPTSDGYYVFGCFIYGELRVGIGSTQFTTWRHATTVGYGDFVPVTWPARHHLRSAGMRVRHYCDDADRRKYSQRSAARALIVLLQKLYVGICNCASADSNLVLL